MDGSSGPGWEMLDDVALAAGAGVALGAEGATDIGAAGGVAAGTLGAAVVGAAGRAIAGAATGAAGEATEGAVGAAIAGAGDCAEAAGPVALCARAEQTTMSAKSMAAAAAAARYRSCQANWICSDRCAEPLICISNSHSRCGFSLSVWLAAEPQAASARCRFTLE